jgi:hypothetical protein
MAVIIALPSDMTGKYGGHGAGGRDGMRRPVREAETYAMSSKHAAGTLGVVIKASRTAGMLRNHG